MNHSDNFTVFLKFPFSVKNTRLQSLANVRIQTNPQITRFHYIITTYLKLFLESNNIPYKKYPKSIVKTAIKIVLSVLLK